MLAPQGSTTRLPLALIFALASRPARDPIVHLTGGWATWSCVEAQLPVDAGLNRDRELIRMEQRGSYLTQPELKRPASGRRRS